MKKESLVVSGIVFLLLLTLVSASNLNIYGKIIFNVEVSANHHIALWLPFDEGTGCTANDISQYNNDGTLKPGCPSNNATWSSSCKFGNCLNFDGSDDYVEVPHSTSLNIGDSGITLEAWIKADAFPSGDRWQIIGKADAYALQVSDGGKVRVWLGPLTTYVQTDSIVLQINTWHHIAGVYDGTSVKIYVDGVLKKEVSKTGNQATSTNNLFIGARVPSGYFNGIIDEPRIWNIALTADQIQSIYQAGAS
jgi:hypothetical protein